MLTNLLSPGKTFYLVGGLASLLVAVTIFAVSHYWRFSGHTRRQLKGLILTACWSCFSLMVLILFSSWQGLAGLGSPKFFWLVMLGLVLWLVGISIYRLTIFHRRLQEEQRAAVYSSYLPKKKVSPSGH